MSRDKDIWKEIETEQKRYDNLNTGQIINYNKFYLYSIIAHSTAIEGSSLTTLDTQLLFDDGITSKDGKPIADYLMNLDLKSAYEYAMKEAQNKTLITPEFLKKLNSLVMKSTGSEYKTMLGSFDSSKGDFRLLGVRVGNDGPSYMNYQKIPGGVEKLADEINKRLGSTNMKDAYNLSFDAHFNLVTIHPWVDGNGRTSRLLMNYIQFYHGLTLTKIHREDKDVYIKALVESKESESPEPFRNFMAAQHLKTLREELNHHEISEKKSRDFDLLF